MVLPITGLWLVYSASKTSQLPNRAIAGIKLFKATVITSIVIDCLLVLVFIIIIAVFFFVDSSVFAEYQVFSSYSGDVGTTLLKAVAITIFVFLAIFTVFIIIYFRSILRVLRGLRDGLSGLVVSKLSGLSAFLVLTYIFTALTTLTALITLVTTPSNPYYENAYTFSNMSDILPDNIFFSSAILTNIGNRYIISSFSSLLYNIGIIICIIVLNRFGKALWHNFYTANQVNKTM